MHALVDRTDEKPPAPALPTPTIRTGGTIAGVGLCMARASALEAALLLFPVLPPFSLP